MNVRLAPRPGISPVLVAGIGLLVAAAWAGLWLWGQSPEARFLHHGSAGAAAAVEIGLFVAGWAVMVTAMMLPTSLPLVTTFAAVVARRPRPNVLVGLVVGGYLATWVAFGAALYLGDRLLHAVVEATPWLADNPQLIAGGTLIVAGAYQFSSLKYRCLDACRSPLGFVVGRWHGERPRLDAVRIGVDHGLFCLGCCWSLMLVMFGLGLGSLAWMLALGTLMALEKNAPIGRRLGRPVGAVLLLAGLATLAG